MKKTIMGIVIGLSLAIAPITFSAYYSSSKSAKDLTAYELKSVIQDVLDECKVKTEFGTNNYHIDC